MATAVVRQFIQAVNQSPELLAQCRPAFEGAEGPSAFVALARQAGFQFSDDEARSFFAEILGAGPPHELSDTQLEGVAGGSKKMPIPDGTALRDAVDLFRGLELTRVPGWTSYRP